MLAAIDPEAWMPKEPRTLASPGNFAGGLKQDRVALGLSLARKWCPMKTFERA
jgi:hypothetical protein